MYKKISIIALFVCCFLSVNLFAQTKIIDKSSRKMPKWCKLQEKGFLMVNVKQSTLQKAQDAAMDRVKEMIAQSVAQNVISDEFSKVSETTEKGKSEVEDIYFSFTKTHSARLPFLKGISFANATGVYWQKVKIKKTKEIYYNYFLRYPYSSLDQSKLIDEYTSLDKEKEAELEAIDAQQYHMAKVSDIADGLRRLSSLKEFFFDSVRKSKVLSLEKAYQKLYSMISVSGAFVSPTEYVCFLSLNGYPIQAEQLPRFTSNCATKIVLKQDKADLHVSFSTEDCLPMEDNHITLDFRVAGKKISHTFYVTSEQERALYLLPEGNVYIFADSIADTTLTDITIKLSVNNVNASSFILKGIQVRLPELVAPIVMEDVNAPYTAGGVISLKFAVKGEWLRTVGAKNVLPYVKGSLEVMDPATQRTSRVLINLPYTLNW